MSFIWQEFGCFKSHLHGQHFDCDKVIRLQNHSYWYNGVMPKLGKLKTISCPLYRHTKTKEKRNQNLADNKKYFILQGTWLPYVLCSLTNFDSNKVLRHQKNSYWYQQSYAEDWQTQNQFLSSLPTHKNKGEKAKI